MRLKIGVKHDNMAYINKKKIPEGVLPVRDKL